MRVHNAKFAEGMFTSVQAGVASLPAGIEGFLLLPVDVPLIRASTVRRVLDKAAATRAPIVHPTFRGERGHPPFIGRALFGEILESDGEGGLRAILARHEREAASVAVFDRGCLQDMDCPEDYRRLVAALAHHHVPDAEECEAMLEAAAAPGPVRRHCRAVAALATRIARQLNKPASRSMRIWCKRRLWFTTSPRGVRIMPRRELRACANSDFPAWRMWLPGT